MLRWIHKILPDLVLSFSSEEQHFLNKVVKLVGWGVIYDESWKNGGKMQHSTSCMTTNEGPDGDHYEPCKIAWVISLLLRT